MPLFRKYYGYDDTAIGLTVIIFQGIYGNIGVSTIRFLVFDSFFARKPVGYDEDFWLDMGFGEVSIVLIAQLRFPFPLENFLIWENRDPLDRSAL